MKVSRQNALQGKKNVMSKEEVDKDLPATDLAREDKVKKVVEEGKHPDDKRGATSSDPSQIANNNSQLKSYPGKPPSFSSEARSLAEQLEEPNVNSIQRLIEIFGIEFISRQVEEASKLYTDALARGKAAYVQPDTAVATGKSKPRTRGGVFFFLMRKHCSNLGLNWNGLRIAPPAWYERKPKKQTVSSESTGGPEFGVAATNSPATLVSTSTLSNQQSHPPYVPNPKAEDSEVARASSISDANIASASRPTDVNPPAGESSEKTLELKGEGSPRPTRLKATVIGSLLARPKVNPNGKEGLVELRFKAEMNSSSLPKGLPDLGGSRVVVWCTKKQFEKVLQQIELTPQTRFIVEGEPVPAVSADLTPFLRIVCTRLTTIELEQKRYPALS